jgi:hypothetical protein
MGAEALSGATSWKRTGKEVIENQVVKVTT